MKGSEAKFPTKLIWEFWGWEQIKALRTSTQLLFVFSKGLCSVPFPNSSSTALFVRPDISSAGSLTNIFRNNLHGGSHAAPSVGTSKHWVLQVLPELTHRSVTSAKCSGQVTLITLAVIWMWRVGLAQKSSATHSETAQPSSVIWTKKGFCSQTTAWSRQEAWPSA